MTLGAQTPTGETRPERRRFARFDVRWPVEYPLFGEKFFAKTANISRGGMLVAGDSLLPEDDVQFWVYGDGAPPLSVTGKVRLHGDSGTHVQFIDAGNPALAEFIERTIVPGLVSRLGTRRDTRTVHLLASWYRELGEETRALEVCRQAARGANTPGPYVELAQLLLAHAKRLTLQEGLEHLHEARQAVGSGLKLVASPVLVRLLQEIARVEKQLQATRDQGRKRPSATPQSELATAERQVSPQMLARPGAGAEPGRRARPEPGRRARPDPCRRAASVTRGEPEDRIGSVRGSGRGFTPGLRATQPVPPPPPPDALVVAAPSDSVSERLTGPAITSGLGPTRPIPPPPDALVVAAPNDSVSEQLTGPAITSGLGPTQPIPRASTPRVAVVCADKDSYSHITDGMVAAATPRTTETVNDVPRGPCWGRWLAAAGLLILVGGGLWFWRSGLSERLRLVVASAEPATLRAEPETLPRADLSSAPVIAEARPQQLAKLEPDLLAHPPGQQDEEPAAQPPGQDDEEQVAPPDHEDEEPMADPPDREEPVALPPDQDAEGMVTQPPDPDDGAPATVTPKRKKRSTSSKRSRPSLARDSQIPDKLVPPPAAAEPVAPSDRLARAKGYFKERKMLLAVKELEALTREQPRNADAYRMLGVAYNLVGRERNSIDAFRRFITLAPSHKHAAKMRAIIEDFERRNRGG